jgi:hypothetical protein
MGVETYRGKSTVAGLSKKHVRLERTPMQMSPKRVAVLLPFQRGSARQRPSGPLEGRQLQTSAVRPGSRNSVVSTPWLIQPVEFVT